MGRNEHPASSNYISWQRCPNLQFPAWNDSYHGIHVFKVALPCPATFHAGDGEVCVSSPNLRLQETARRRDGRCPQGAARWYTVVSERDVQRDLYQFIIPESYNII